VKTKWALTLAFDILPLGPYLASTDSISDADLAQSGYLPNHNINPAVINSTLFKILWIQTFNASEVVRLCKNPWGEDIA
jgi:hypothetical protein